MWSGHATPDKVRFSTRVTRSGPGASMSFKLDYDVVGAGFGPANAALAVLLADARTAHGSTISARFFEQHSRASWHPGMLLPGTTTQDTFLEDLVTPRDPRSRFTFLSYLHHQ